MGNSCHVNDDFCGNGEATYGSTASPLGLDTSSGRFTGQADYSAFGEMIGGNNPGAFQSVYQWGAQSGYRTDGASGGGGDAGLVLVGARYYDPAVGRFTSRDSDLSQAPYAYCDGDPVNFTDPSGHDADGWAALGVGAGGMYALSSLNQAAYMGGYAADATGASVFVPVGASAAGVVTIGIITIGALAYAAYKLIGEPIANYRYGPDTYPELPAPSRPIRERPDPRDPVMFKFYVPLPGGYYSSAGFGDTNQSNQTPPPRRDY